MCVCVYIPGNTGATTLSFCCCGEGGGGRSDMAQAGGQNIKKIDFALEKLKNFIKERI